MILKQLIRTNNWATILPMFLELYPEAKKDIDDYKAVFEQLAMMQHEEIDMSIIISLVKDEYEEYVDVSGLHNNPKTAEEKYSVGIEFIPWRKWLSMDINKESLDDFLELEIIVHCLYEMTFVGFSEEDIHKVLNRSEKSIKERESMTEEERDAITASVEEILSEWRDENGD